MNSTRNFDLEAAFWDEKPGRLQLARAVSEAILAAAAPNPGDHALDFGCGTGLVSLPWADRVARLTGVDTSEGMRTMFAQKAAQLGLRHVDTAADDGSTPLPGPVNYLVSSMTLHHVADIPALFRRLAAVLAPGGVACLADLDPDGGLFHEDNTGVFHFGFERSHLEEALRAVGLVPCHSGTATSITRTGGDGISRTFTIFLIVAKKPA